MKILVTGPNGFVGKYIMRAIPEAVPLAGLRKHEADIAELVDGADVIIHTAAISDMSVCEKNPEESYKANVLLPAALAGAAKGAKLVFFSSDQVYNGCRHKGPYDEETVNPVNVYARHKLEMEQRVQAVSPDAVLLRPTWMFDMNWGFLANIRNAAGEIEAPVQYRGVTWVQEVADNIRKTFALPGGAYNFGSENELPMHELITGTLSYLGKDNHVRESCVRHNLWMNTAKAQQYGIAFSPSAAGIRRCIESNTAEK